MSVSATRATSVRHDTEPLDPEAWLEDKRQRHGTIYHDTASKGWKNGKRVFSDRWRAEITIQGTRYRHRAAHTLHLGRDRTLTASRQAVGLILTKIVGGRPVTNITFTCKRMLRTYASRGDFWYYDKAPETVKLMVNRIDMSALAELYKVTKDRRI